ncbi:MAG: RNA-binding S4 domain-containing protein [Marinicaulis sp.]|nr:RNA-binding S4 domain-containing protein [Marinicaulis sp.]NNE40488.1 RNA-binding S4 domain-containing protein [Marinicaulis sp.]NNL89556.1 RNA-binding S4 domain-containing protein [Marinicaulis sp.]
MTREDDAVQSQRIDRWLWSARFFKTRTLASKFVNDFNVRISRGTQTNHAEKPSTTVREGDTLVFTKNERLKIIEIVKLAERRGPATEARTLYVDKSPPPPPKKEKQLTVYREKGAGRPTKKDRRAIDAIKPH